MELTVFYDADTWYWYHMGNTLWQGHDNAILIDWCSRTYKDISYIDSDIQELREHAVSEIRKILNRP